MKQLYFSFAGALLLLVGNALVGPPAGPDVEFTRVQVLGVLAVSLAFSASCIGWGAWLTSRLQARGAARGMIALACGTLFSSLAAMALGTAGFISYSSAWLAMLWIAGGWWAGSAFFSSFRFSLGRSWIPAVLFAAGFALWLGAATLANGATDPFFYHLLGPRVWTDSGKIVFLARFPALAQASYWECLFIWGNLLFGDEGGRGLIAGQLFGQLIHVELGAALSFSAVFTIARSFLRGSLWPWLAVLLCMCSTGLDITAFLAKNDFGCAGWAVTGLALLYAKGSVWPDRRRREIALAGLFLGVSILAKVVLVIPVSVALAVWVAWPGERKRLADVVWLGSGVLAGMAPEMLRNFAYLGDPVFPFLLQKLGLLERWAGPTSTMLLYKEAGGPARDFSRWLWTVWKAQSDIPFFAPVVLLFPLAAWLRPSLRRAIPLFLTVELTFVLYASWSFDSLFTRWLSPALLLNGVVAVLVWSEAAEWLAGLARSRATWVRALAFGIPAAVIYGPIAFDWSAWEENTWRSVFSGNSPTIMIRQPQIHHGGDAMAWLRLYAEPGARIATTGFRQFYYVSHLPAVSIQDHPAVDSATFGLRRPARVIEVLRAFGVRYVLDVAHWNQRFYGGSFGPMITDLAFLFPRTMVFSSASGSSFILDLEKLEGELLGRCSLPDPRREWEWYS